ncbi:thiol reductant ABC exporter subunit CydC [Gordonia sp. ABSL49_1]|uniref:thiol reductant ABC exporter subunit CydC n=1 Tax=unclassified Gordonia (in: high G+C Gram-positive bacteria) TaxID=2657482 RepID=UPI001F0E81F5|nr:thiol reductant ABC exporter subunit CydC [Gordonia sp. ABSL49_1]MCH5645282.1 thiol reductant ABC exporter subunit CydC [Gordonia sp. ABSL49_1]
MRQDPLIRALGFLGLKGRPVVRSLLLGVGGALSALGLAALSAWLITRAWQMPPVLFLSVAITAVRALGISRGLFRYLERLATHDLALGAMASARERVYIALASGSPAYSVTLRRGDLLTRTGDDIDEIGNALIRGIIPIGVGLTTSVAAVVIMALVSVWAALVLGAALIVSGVVAPWLAARGASRSIADASSATTQSAEATTTALWHAPELVVARRRPVVLDAASDADRDALAAADRGLRWQAAAAAATPLSLGASLLAACMIGIHLASQVSGSLADVSSGHGLTPMILGVLILLPLSAFESTAPLTEAGIQIETSRQSAARVMALVDAAGTDPDAGGDASVHFGPVALDLDRMRWGWSGSEALGPVSGLDRTLPAGSRLAVVGPSGSGKSTLLLTLAGLLAPQSGSVSYSGSGAESVEPRSAATYFAEDAHIFSTSIRENLRVARGDASEGEMTSALDRVGLWAWVTGLPDGLDTVLAGGSDAISGGQRRRLLLARALLQRAPVVLLDEPTEHLDADDADPLMRQILDPADGLFGPDRTVVVVTHQLPDGTGADVVDLAAVGV